MNAQEKKCLTPAIDYSFLEQNDSFFVEVSATGDGGCKNFFSMIDSWKFFLPSNRRDFKKEVLFVYSKNLLLNKNPVAGLALYDSRRFVLLLKSNPNKTHERETFVHELSSLFFLEADAQQKKEWNKLHNYHVSFFPERKTESEYVEKVVDPWSSSYRHLRHGFLCSYSLSDSENDFNVYAQFWYSKRAEKKQLLLFAIEKSEIAAIKFKLFERMMPTNVSF